MNSTGTLYILPGSLHSKRAADAVVASGIKCKIVPVSDERLALLHRDLGIRELPTLIIDSARFVGLSNIEKYLTGRGGK